MSDRERLEIVAHELRSPVAALAALVDALPTVPRPARRRVVVLAVAAGRDIERICRDADLLSLQPERIDLASLVAGFASDDVVVSLDGEPAVDGDATRLRQVIGNLVANGLRHGSSVAIDVAQRDGSVVLDISDDGPGVEAGIDPFARGASDAGSTGIGLWLSRRIAEAHGGSLDLVRDGGGGARFRLALPSASAAR
jgi:signal transduction histidine kinase